MAVNHYRKPAVMLRVDHLKGITQALTNEQIGIVLKAVLEYEETKADPVIEDPGVFVAFTFLKSALDHDDLRYNRRRFVNKYNAYCRWEKEKGRVPMPVEDYLIMCSEAEAEAGLTIEEEIERALSNGNK